MAKLKAWPNKLGYDYGDWEIYEASQGNWIAREIPAWFGAPTRVGSGTTWHEAILNAETTEEYQHYIDLMEQEHREEQARDMWRHPTKEMLIDGGILNH